MMVFTLTKEDMIPTINWQQNEPDVRLDLSELLKEMPGPTDKYGAVATGD